MADAERKMTIVFSVEQRRPGCVNLQAVMGGTVPNFLQLFDNDTWLLTPTGLKCYAVTEAQLRELAAMAKAAVKTTPTKISAKSNGRNK